MKLINKKFINCMQLIERQEKIKEGYLMSFFRSMELNLTAKQSSMAYRISQANLESVYQSYGRLFSLLRL